MTAGTLPRSGAPVLERPDDGRRRRRIILLFTVFLWLPSACTAFFSSSLYQQSIPDGRAFFIDPTIDLVPGSLQVTGLIAASLLPGDEVVATLAVTNRSIVPLRLALSTVADTAGGLADALHVAIRLEDGLCTGHAPVLYDGPLATASVGQPGLGGDDEGVVQAATRMSLCLVVRLPLLTDDQYQDASASVRFLVAAGAAR
jgi:hypothetical protein